jgi:hypothetical protein
VEAGTHAAEWFCAFLCGFFYNKPFYEKNRELQMRGMPIDRQRYYQMEFYVFKI